jgi:hypothetical protein
VSEHGWPGWSDDGHIGDEHHDPHDADHLGGADLPPEVDTPAWAPEQHWDPVLHDVPDPVADPVPAHEPLVDHDLGEHEAAEYTDDAPGADPVGADGAGYGPLGPVGADPDAVGDLAADPVFPSELGVDLPEPVDGFPWIDTGTLGMVAVDQSVIDAGHVPVDSAELAAYAQTELPPAVDPWAELAGSDDPATSALATFWKPED